MRLKDAKPQVGLGELQGRERRYHTKRIKRTPYQDALDLLYRGKWIIAGACVIGLSLAYLYNRFTPPVFEAYSLTLVQTQNPSNVSIIQRGGEPFLQEERSLSNEVLILRQSLQIATQVAEQLLRMEVVPATQEPLSIIYGGNGEKLEAIEVAQRLHNDYLTVLPENRDVDAIRIIARSNIPAESALLANMYAEEFQSRTLESSRAQVKASRTFLEEREQRLSEELAEKEDALKAYMSRRGAVALDQEAQQTVRQVADLEAQRDATLIDLQNARATLTSLENRLGEVQPALVQLLSAGTGRELERLHANVLEWELLRDETVRKNPRVLNSNTPASDPARQQYDTLVQQIATLQSQIADLSQQYVDEVQGIETGAGSAGNIDGAGLQYVAQLKQRIAEERINISRLEAQEDVLQRRMQDYEGRIRSIPSQSIELAQLQREQQATEQLYLTIVDKLQEARVAEESEIGYVDIIRQAILPRAPIKPRKNRNLAIGLFFGLAVGIALSMLWRMLDKRIYRPEDLQEKGYNLLGTIPNMSSLIRRQYNNARTVTRGGHTFSTDLVALLHPSSRFAEAYRHVRVNTQYSHPESMVLQAIMVASASSGEGRTALAANLAIITAQAGYRTLLLDADLSNPAQHASFGLSRKPGVVDLLFGAPLDVNQMATPIEGLYVIPAGSPVPNPSEILGSRGMEEFIQKLRLAFDVIIFDAPPVMAASDAALLATQCDASVVVAAAGETKEHELEFTYDTLHGVGGIVLGTVLNRFDASMAYGYKYKYKQKKRARMDRQRDQLERQLANDSPLDRPRVPSQYDTTAPTLQQSLTAASSYMTTRPPSVTPGFVQPPSVPAPMQPPPMPFMPEDEPMAAAREPAAIWNPNPPSSPLVDFNASPPPPLSVPPATLEPSMPLPEPELPIVNTPDESLATEYGEPMPENSADETFSSDDEPQAQQPLPREPLVAPPSIVPASPSIDTAALWQPPMPPPKIEVTQEETWQHEPSSKPTSSPSYGNDDWLSDARFEDIDFPDDYFADDDSPAQELPPGDLDTLPDDFADDWDTPG